MMEHRYGGFYLKYLIMMNNLEIIKELQKKNKELRRKLTIISKNNSKTDFSRGKRCWLCGNRNYLTKHHIIPKRFNPQCNMKIPLCKECHILLHKNYSNSLFYYNNYKPKGNKLQWKKTLGY